MVGYSQFSLGGLSPGSNFFSYSDADGDGLKNFEDSDPANMDIDGDSILNWNEAPGQMNDPYNGTTPPPLDDPGVIIGGNWYPTGTLDSDGDGTPDQLDPFPFGSFTYQGFEYGGSWSDRDADYIPDPADSFPDGSYWYNAVEYAAPFVDQDGDTVPDALDPWPTIAGSFWYFDPNSGTSTEYPGVFVDQDGDGVPDPLDPWPTIAGSYVYNGTQYPGPWLDSDSDGTPDAFDSDPYGTRAF